MAGPISGLVPHEMIINPHCLRHLSKGPLPCTGSTPKPPLPVMQYDDTLGRVAEDKRKRVEVPGAAGAAGVAGQDPAPNTGGRRWAKHVLPLSPPRRNSEGTGSHLPAFQGQNTITTSSSCQPDVSFLFTDFLFPSFPCTDVGPEAVSLFSVPRKTSGSPSAARPKASSCES